MKVVVLAVLLCCVLGNAQCPYRGKHTVADLGHLKLLEGTWVGEGFNMIAVPNGDYDTGSTDYRIISQRTNEQIVFTAIPGPVPNRGSLISLGDKHRRAQQDIDIYALTYLQTVSDIDDPKNLIHVENGMWLNVPATDVLPIQEATIVRQSSIPHGDVLIAQSTLVKVVNGPPRIDDVDCFPIGDRVDKKGYLDLYYDAQLPQGIPHEMFRNPNLMLVADIEHQNIIETIVIKVSTRGKGGIVNIPNVERNADVTEVDCILWIETVLNSDGTTHLQLQYTQTVILDFLGIEWPHITVGTLTKV